MWNVLLSVLITLAVLGLFRLGHRLAHRHRHLHARAPAWMTRHLARRLEATPEQERVLAAEMEALRLAVAELRGDLLGSREDLARALAGERLDPSAMDALAARATTRLDALRARLVASLARVHGALDARQRQALADLVRSGPRTCRAHVHA